MQRRPALTLIEMLIVLVIIATMIGLLIPAVQATRERARETVCKNNLHQLNLAVAMFSSAHKALPKPGVTGQVSGWMVEILPFIEQNNLKDGISGGMSISSVPQVLYRPPSIFNCPRREVIDRTPESQIQPGHYALHTDGSRDTYSLSDSPISNATPWLTGVELHYSDLARKIGPHSKGFFVVYGGQQGLYFQLKDKSIRQ